MSDRERIHPDAPDYITQGLSLDSEFYNRMIRALSLINAIDPQQVQPPKLRLDRRASAQITLADFTEPPFRRIGRRVAAFGDAVANAGNASYVQLINPTDSNVIAVVSDVVFTCAVAVKLYAAWGAASITLASPGAGTQPPQLETQQQGQSSGAPAGTRGLSLAPLLMIASNNFISGGYTQISAAGAAAAFADLPLGLVLWPGMTVVIVGSAINNEVIATFRTKLYDLPSLVPQNIFP